MVSEPLTPPVKVTAKARKVTVVGPRGSITKDFTHQSLDIRVIKLTTGKKKGTFCRIQQWNGNGSQNAAVSTIASHINNMVTGVTEVSVPPPFCFGVLLTPAGIQIQDETGVRSFPHQRHHFQGQDPS